MLSLRFQFNIWTHAKFRTLVLMFLAALMALAQPRSASNFSGRWSSCRGSTFDF
jgi:hypothetical protein